MRRPGEGWLEDIARSLLALALYCGVIGGAGYAAYGFIKDPRWRDAPQTAAPAGWQELATTQRTLGLAMEDFLDGEPRHVVLRHPAGGRRDRIVWGAPATREAYLAIELYRPGAEAEPAHAFAMLAADVAETATSADAGTLTSKFGTFSVTRGREKLTDRHCFGFLQRADENALRIVGVYCARSEPARLADVAACALDRLALVTAHGDGRLAGVFARAQLKQSTCGPGKLPAASVPQRNAWIDAENSPVLRAGRP